MFGRFNPGNFNNFNYTSNDVNGEEHVGDGSATIQTLGWGPIIPGSVTCSLSTGTTVVDDGNGNFGTLGTIDYNTGKITFSSATVSGTVYHYTYKYANTQVPAQAPEMNFSLRQTPIVANWRTLKSLQSIFAQLNYQAEFGQDMASYASKYAAIELKHEIDGEIISDLADPNFATGTGVNVNLGHSVGVNALDNAYKFVQAIAEVDMNMYNDTKMAQPTFYVLGADAATRMRMLPDTFFKASGENDPKGSFKLGTFQGKPVYMSPVLAHDKWLAGYKGNGLADAGYVYAPYLPIVATDYIKTADFVAQQGFATAYGKQKVNGAFYALSTVTNTPEIIKTQTA